MAPMKSLLTGILVAAVFFACGGDSGGDAAAGPLKTYEEREVLWVEPDDVDAYLEAGNDDVIFVDNRNAFSFTEQHIAEARLIPTDQMARSLGSLPLNKWLILYCT